MAERKYKPYYIKAAQNVFGETIKSCGAGTFNLSKIDDVIYLNIYLANKLELTIICYKHPYHLAAGILGTRMDPYKIINQIKKLKSEGLIEGKDFTITAKGVFKKYY